MHRCENDGMIVPSRAFDNKIPGDQAKSDDEQGQSDQDALDNG